MKLSLTSAFLAAAVLSLTGCSFAQDWEPLVKEGTLEGWTKRGGNADYKVSGDVVTGVTAPGQKENTFLCTDKEYADFELEYEFKVDPRMNSGVQIRSASLPEFKKGRVHGYQVEIDPSPRAFTAAIYDEARRAKFLADLKDNPEARAAFKQNEWNKIQVSCMGNIIKTKINGVNAVEVKDDMSSSGFIALQVHATTATEPMEVSWRNIRIKDWTEARKATWETDSPQGDYAGKLAGGEPLAAQVIDLGGGKFQAKLLQTLETPGAALGEAKGTDSGEGIDFTGDAQGQLKDKKFSGEMKGEKFELSFTERKSPTEGAKAPEGAVVLFDGTNLEGWQGKDNSPCPWKIADNKTLEVVANTGNIHTAKGFTDQEIHIEFRTSFMPKARGQQRANSGVYIQGSYEVQILDSFGLEGVDNECGGIYKVGKPLVNMAYPPLAWQTYDISFKAAKYDAAGTKAENARVTVKHNGVVVQDNMELKEATGGAKFAGEPKGPAPLMLQDHGNPIQFRNMWVSEK